MSIYLIPVLFLIIFFLLQIRELQESYLQNQQDKTNNSYNSQYDSYEIEIPQSILNAITEEDLQREFGEDILNQVDDGTFNTIDELKNIEGFKFDSLTEFANDASVV